MRCGGKEEKSVRKSPGMVIYDATPLLSQSALFSLSLLFLIVHHVWRDQYCRYMLATKANCTVRVKINKYRS